MSAIDFLIERFAENSQGAALIWEDRAYSYSWLLEQITRLRGRMDDEQIRVGAVVALEADFSPLSISWLLALIEHGCIVVPISPAAQPRRDELMATAQVETSIRVGAADHIQISHTGISADHALYADLRAQKHPGLVIFSSGSTGVSKAALHDCAHFLEKYQLRRPAFRLAAFLLFDHMGGVNTLFHTLSNLGCLVILARRNPDDVLAAVERHRIEVLPISPTFLNLMLLSEAHQRYDLSSLKTVSYGAEPMPETTLKRFHSLFPEIKLHHMYGMSEVGILRSRSKSPDSVAFQIGGDGYETRVVDDMLQIRGRSVMLGYLNAPNPFTEDGWLMTGDAVEREGEHIRILGRASEIINVGGEKVYPAEVENVIQQLDDVAEVTVYGERSPLLGNIVCARVTPARALSDAESRRLERDVKRYCRERLRPYQVPVKLSVIAEAQHGARFKRVRV